MTFTVWFAEDSFEVCKKGISGFPALRLLNFNYPCLEIIMELKQNNKLLIFNHFQNWSGSENKDEDYSNVAEAVAEPEYRSILRALISKAYRVKVIL